jgi:hypothetical protein
LILADNSRAGFEARKVNASEEAVFENSLIVGRSANNSNPMNVEIPTNSCAISFPITDGFRARNILITNFDADTHIVESASGNDSPRTSTVGGK